MAFGKIPKGVEDEGAEHALAREQGNLPFEKKGT